MLIGSLFNLLGYTCAGASLAMATLLTAAFISRLFAGAASRAASANED
jgi:hypothetical protein